ncbi:GNAT family N-acetyltransferase [Candidatus Viridilinea mediisalina]|uniref:N-acetyltransferase domain-containing protein n=1 Tax=Candidatus Viridilinea mediisalina TaxID=2024553 RepID=A0A2A6RJF4_9CHLR|nr:GNAT family N-acetyltransferase [Candidatus Viridilinea mediisalina]PDW03254.1 hypothetical protein CJ255_09725 [Candidatus Viridilinea mediisalina]
MMHIETTHQGLQVHTLPVAQLASAAALVAASFRQEGFTRNTHNLSTPARQRRYAIAGELRLWFGHVSGQRLLAVSEGETLAGIAVVKPPTPTSVPWPKLLWTILRRAPSLVGIIGDLRWRQALRIKPAMKAPAMLPPAHYTLELLAVAPEFQGQGIGRLLLEDIHARCEQDRQAAGIYLFTGDEKNREIYQRFGYHVLQANQGGPLTVWHMFRPNAPSILDE